MDTEPVNQIKAVETTIRILETIKDESEVGVTELAEILNMPKSTVFSHLNTLLENKFVTKRNAKYSIGLRFLEFGEFRRHRMELWQTAEPELADVAAETGELVNLMVEEFGEGVYLGLTPGEQAVQLDTYPGKREELHCIALGKAILANLPDHRIESILPEQLTQYTPNTITDREELLEELSQIREAGVAFDDEEQAAGLRCVAAPIMADGDAVGAISVSGPTPRMKEQRFNEILPELLTNAASVIQINMKYSRND